MGKQKIYKSLFSILLTGICVTAVTYAASVSYIKDGEVLTESYMTSLVSALNGKANLSEVYTKAQVDAKIPNCAAGEFITANGTSFSCTGGVEVTPPKNPTSGSCGNSQNQSFTSRPSTNLCNSGSLVWADNTGTDGTYNWQCLGSDGGSNASCSAAQFECGPKTFKIYEFGSQQDYSLTFGNLGDKKSTDGHEYGCEYYGNRYEDARLGSQEISYTFTCTSSGWIKAELKGPCTDAMYR